MFPIICMIYHSHHARCVKKGGSIHTPLSPPDSDGTTFKAPLHQLDTSPLLSTHDRRTMYVRSQNACILCPNNPAPLSSQPHIAYLPRSAWSKRSAKNAPPRRHHNHHLPRHLPHGTKDTCMTTTKMTRSGLATTAPDKSPQLKENLSSPRGSNTGCNKETARAGGDAYQPCLPRARRRTSFSHL